MNVILTSSSLSSHMLNEFCMAFHGQFYIVLPPHLWRLYILADRVEYVIVAEIIQRGVHALFRRSGRVVKAVVGSTRIH